MDKNKIIQVLSMYGGQNLWSPQVQNDISDDILYLFKNDRLPHQDEIPPVIEEAVIEEAVVEETVVEESSEDDFFEEPKKSKKETKKKSAYNKLVSRKPLTKGKGNVSRSQK